MRAMATRFMSCSSKALNTTEASIDRAVASMVWKVESILMSNPTSSSTCFSGAIGVLESARGSTLCSGARAATWE
eukprot:CAMPEP_0180120264 /NCGR_PEP_ID=MMETSP0986-20121125/2425_1 /TAXON_ID=697907 /ORGANISM="non described non described, Strain CCMP2293" /LENGTH=74 /DNA_ID=CAMNT_0022059325 /DNA_START=175 /DNA_END=399 /DNA_ORIENTATION=+